MSSPAPHSEPRNVAINWFNLRRGGEMSAEDMRAFEVWLHRDPENAALFRQVEATWALLGSMEEEPSVIHVREADERVLDRRRSFVRMSAMAASLTLAAAAGWAVAASNGWSALSFFNPSPQTFKTSVGQRATITLADNSTVTLDTDTVMRARISLWERRIELEHGQAFFQVAKDRSRPFIVMAAGKSVRATGTAFDVRAEPGRFEVTLIEGRVRVEDELSRGEDRAVAEMRPGWRLAVGEDARWRLDTVNVDRQTSWHDGMLSFFNEPVFEAAAEMNRYSVKKIVFRGPPSELALLGNFRAGDVDAFVEALEANKLARVVSKSRDRIELSAR